MALFSRKEQEQNRRAHWWPLPVPVCCGEDVIIECASLSWQSNVITSPSTEEGPAPGKRPLIQLPSETKKNGQQTLSRAIDWEVWNHPQRFFSKSPLLQCFLQRDKETRGGTVKAAASVRCPHLSAFLWEKTERMETKGEKPKEVLGAENV